MANGEDVTREEHVEWCKKRAFVFIDERDDLAGAMSSFLSDMNKNAATKEQILDRFILSIGQDYLVKQDKSQLRHWIDGF